MQWVKLTNVKPNPNNPRVIRDDKFAKLKQSIIDFPEMLEKRPLVCYTEGEHYIVLGGNMRLKALSDIGAKEIPIILADEWTEEQRAQFLIKDNVGFGEWDWNTLANEWDADKLTEWGLDLPPMDAIELEAEEDDYEMPDELQTDIVLGDLFEIGEHRLLCGDSTDSDAVARLMDGVNDAFCFTSPPYNAGDSEKLSGNMASANRANLYESYDDEQSPDDWKQLCEATINNAMMHCQVVAYNIQMLANNKIAFMSLLNDYKQNLIDIAIWNKEHAAPHVAENVMASTFEFILFLSPKTNPTKAITTGKFRAVQNVYSAPPQRNNEFAKHHGATFPMHLPEWVIKTFTTNQPILDLFCGTGTTMVAAHQLKRNCYGMELDPKYCQVIIDRMIKLDPTLEIKRNGQTYNRQTTDGE
jgi:DNA modification methylase